MDVMAASWACGVTEILAQSSDEAYFVLGLEPNWQSITRSRHLCFSCI